MGNLGFSLTVTNPQFGILSKQKPRGRVKEKGPKKSRNPKQSLLPKKHSLKTLMQNEHVMGQWGIKSEKRQVPEFELWGKVGGEVEEGGGGWGA